MSPSRCSTFRCAPCSTAARRARPPTRLDDDSLRRVVETSKSLARSQPRNPDLLPMPGPQKYAKVARYFENTAYATPADRARAVATRRGNGREKQANGRRHFFDGRHAIGDCQYQRPFRIASPDARRIFHHHSRIRFLRLGQGQFARPQRNRSRGAGPQRERKISRLAQAERSRARTLDRDSRTFGRARSRRISLLRFCGHGDGGPALLLQQAHGQKSPGRKHHAPRRRVPPAAVRRALRRRRNSAPENSAGGQRRPDAIWCTRAPRPKK